MKNKVVSVRTGCQFLSKNWPGHVHIKLKGRQPAVISAQHGYMYRGLPGVLCSHIISAPPKSGTAKIALCNC